MNVLVTADLHIGRRPTALPSHIDARRISAASAWGALVELAIAERVDVVALAGDVVDRANRFFEAFGPLEGGLRRLEDAGIAVVAVGGNHDFDVLPRLADGARGVHLQVLGRGGRWERASIRTRRGETLNIDGWSFPTEHVVTSPLADYAPDDSAGVPTIALLHADIDQPRSRYAPALTAELHRRHGVDLWVVGHVHRPMLSEGPGRAPILCPGSPQALDPGETGAHGAWLVRFRVGQAPAVRFVPLSRVRYESVLVDVDGVSDVAEAEQRLVDGVRHRLSEAVAEGGPLRHLSCRVRLTGRTPLHRTLPRRLELFRSDLELTDGEVTATVEAVEPDTRPAVDLRELARGNDPPAHLARLLLALDSADPVGDHAQLLAAAHARAAEVRSGRPYLALPSEETVALDDELPRVVQRQALLLLDELLAQKEAV